MKRNYGIDLLRILLMLMVVLLHVLGDGGVLDSVEPFSLNYSLAWLLESFAYCAVNCYALITGYFYIDGKYKVSSMILLWFQAFLYTAGIFAAACLLKPDLFYVPDLLEAVFPVSTGAYWYLSAYVGLFVMIPFLNAAICAMPEQKMKKMLFVLFLVFSVYVTFCGGDPFSQLEGYSMTWLILLYIIGACIKKYGFFDDMGSKKALLLYVLSVVVSWVVKLCIETLVIPTADIVQTKEEWIGNILISYVSPTMLFAAVMLFTAFKNLVLPERINKLVALFAPAAFGVYLIHKQEYVSGFFIRDKFAGYASYNTFSMLGAVLFTTVVIFTVCILIDLVRCQVFKVLKIKQRLEAMEHRLMEKRGENR